MREVAGDAYPLGREQHRRVSHRRSQRRAGIRDHLKTAGVAAVRGLDDGPQAHWTVTDAQEFLQREGGDHGVHTPATTASADPAGRIDLHVPERSCRPGVGSAVHHQAAIGDGRGTHHQRGIHASQAAESGLGDGHRFCFSHDQHALAQPALDHRRDVDVLPAGESRQARPAFGDGGGNADGLDLRQSRPHLFAHLRDEQGDAIERRIAAVIRRQRQVLNEVGLPGRVGHDDRRLTATDVHPRR